MADDAQRVCAPPQQPGPVDADLEQLTALGRDAARGPARSSRARRAYRIHDPAKLADRCSPPVGLEAHPVGPTRARRPGSGESSPRTASAPGDHEAAEDERDCTGADHYPEPARPSLLGR